MTPEVQADALSQLLGTTGPIASLLVLGYWLIKGQLEKITNTASGLEAVKLELVAMGLAVVRTNTTVNTLAAALSIKLPEQKD